MSRIVMAIIVGLMILLSGLPALSVQPDEMLEDPVLEARAREISSGLRCVVCQSENIDQSNADLARDLRILVRERLKAGDTDDQVVDFIVARYGDYVLLNPPFQAATYALWFGPAIFLAVGLYAALRFLRSTGARDEVAKEAAPLRPDEQKRLRKLLAEEEQIS
jgi:cytochrome c-type biogenesis protein CcmH